MACASDSSDSDRNIGLPKNHSSSGKRLESSSDEETGQPDWKQTPSSARRATENNAGGRRQSERKRKRELRMPSREERWKSIPTDSKASHKLSSLKPRRLINDFTRITHRYNHDYTEVSGEESMEEFMKATDSSDSTESSSTSGPDRSKRKKHRVKGYRPRIVKRSDASSDDDQSGSFLPQSDAKPEPRNCPQRPAIGQQEKDPESKENKRQKTRKNSRKTETERSVSKESEEKCGSSDEEIQPVSAKKTRRKTELDSDEKESCPNSSSDDSPKRKAQKNSKKSVRLDPDSDKVTKPSVLPTADKQNTGGSARKARRKSALPSNSDSEEKVFADEDLSTDKRASVSHDQECDKQQQTKSMPGTDVSRKDAGVQTPVAEKTGLSKDSAISVDDSDSFICDDDCESYLSDEECDQDSDDELGCEGRIQKLAERKRQRKDSMFDQLKSARAKRQKKN